MLSNLPGPGPGRPPGLPNKATGRAREAIAQFVDGNAERLTEWLDRIAEENPKAAFDSFMSVVEYHIPKLSRAENVNSTVDGVAAMSTERLLQLERIVSRLTGSEALLIAPEPKKIDEDAELLAAQKQSEASSRGTSQTDAILVESQKNGQQTERGDSND